jgi:putative tryptophan/tyrosine transport system substrate-binding protein
MPNHTDTFNPTESVIPNDGDLVFDSTGEGGRSPAETVLPYIEQRVGEAENGGIIINWTSGDGPNGPKGDSVGVIAIITPQNTTMGASSSIGPLAPPARANAWRASVPLVRRAEMVLVRASSSIGLAATARATMHFPLRPSIPWTFIPASIFFSDHQPQGKPGSRCRLGGDSTLSRRALAGHGFRALIIGNPAGLLHPANRRSKASDQQSALGWDDLTQPDSEQFRSAPRTGDARPAIVRSIPPTSTAMGRPMLDVRRREFIALLGSAVAWPMAARAQQPNQVRRIGFLGLDAASSHASRVAAFRAGLRDLGWIEGRNLTIEFRWAEGNYQRLPALAEELVQRNVDVLVTHGAAGALAAKKATSTTPIVITAVADMLTLGLIASLSRPGGNVTGLSLFVAELTAKRLELVKEAVPSLAKVAILVNPSNAATQLVLQETEATAKALQIDLRAFEARQPRDFERVFGAMAEQRVDGVVIHEDTMLTANANALAVFAAARQLPSSGFPELVRLGGLLAYGINFPDTDYRAAAFVDRILKGAKPGDLPVERSTKFKLSVNLQTARALGLDIPPILLVRADEVIE